MKLGGYDHGNKL